jgi:hypothetical protein
MNAPLTNQRGAYTLQQQFSGLIHKDKQSYLLGNKPPIDKVKVLISSSSNIQRPSTTSNDASGTINNVNNNGASYNNNGYNKDNSI